jgi:hypothetical protein
VRKLRPSQYGSQGQWLVERIDASVPQGVWFLSTSGVWGLLSTARWFDTEAAATVACRHVRIGTASAVRWVRQPTKDSRAGAPD